MIYILSSDIRSGKTTALLNWTKARTDVDGILCPDSENGRRYFLKIKNQKRIVLEVAPEAEVSEKYIIPVGPFRFFQSAFAEANDYLLKGNETKNFKYVILDELGKLELKNKGLHDAAKILIPKYEMNEHRHLILVIRTSLLKLLIEHYTISKYKILKINDIKRIDLD